MPELEVGLPLSVLLSTLLTLDYAVVSKVAGLSGRRRTLPNISDSRNYAIVALIVPFPCRSRGGRRRGAVVPTAPDPGGKGVATPANAYRPRLLKSERGRKGGTGYELDAAGEHRIASFHGEEKGSEPANPPHGPKPVRGEGIRLFGAGLAFLFVDGGLDLVPHAIWRVLNRKQLACSRRDGLQFG